MGFMDKAKKMAEQAQAKLDEAQKQFNTGQQGQSSGDAVEYDQHGRPIAQQPAAPSAPPHGDPLAGESSSTVAPSPPPPPATPPADAGAPPAPGVPPTGQDDPVTAPPAAAAPPPPPAPGVPPAGDVAAPGSPPAQPAPDPPEEDRNNPSYAPPKLSSGDPLAG